MFISASLLLVIPCLVSAAPLRINRQQAAANDPNLLVLRFADVLEQLETQFYTQALAKFQDSDFQAAGFLSTQIPIQEFTTIQQDESIHSKVLQGAIKAAGGEPITSCQFDFSSVLGDVKTMAATARLVENVGVGAYLGAAPLITDPVLLVAAGSILTVEARHQSVLNILGGTAAIPNPFDIALTPSEVLAIAGAFVSGCDTGIKANPALAVTNTGPVTAGTSLTFQADALNGSTDGFFCQMMQGGFPFSVSLPLSNCVVPDGLSGPVVIWITSDAQPLLNNVRDRATTQLVAGPTMAFIDSQQEVLGKMVLMGSSGGNGGGSGQTIQGTSTLTISPAQASAIISSASASSTSSASSSASTTASATSSAPSSSSTVLSSSTDTSSPTDSSPSPTDDSSSPTPTDDGDSPSPTDDSSSPTPTDDGDSPSPTDDSSNPSSTDSGSPSPTDDSGSPSPTDSSDPASASPTSGPTNDITQTIDFRRRRRSRSSVFNREYD